MKKVCMITIGQAPRRDVAPIIEKHLGDTVELFQMGALDNLTTAEVQSKFAPKGDERKEYLLTSKMANGKDVVMTRTKLEPVLQQKINLAEELGYKLILLLCTGEFPNLTTGSSVLLEPDKILPPIIKLIVGERKLGVIVPLQEQEKTIGEKFDAVNLNTVYTSASPYRQDTEQFSEAAKKLTDVGAEYILMDCMGFDEKMQDIVSQSSNKPVILSNALIAKVMSEFV